jgi:L-amino acid N-acyltransferase YncA
MLLPDQAVLRPSQDEDIPALTRIYAHYVRETTSSFEIEPPDEAEMFRRRAAILERGLPYIVAEMAGVVTGYAYASPYRPRLAYRFTVEDSIYVDPRFAGRGLGRALLSAVIVECERQGYRQMIAVIGGSDNAASIGLHRSLGFEPAGVLSGAGYKLGRWADSVLMQKSLGAGFSTHPQEIQPISTLT